MSRSLSAEPPARATTTTVRVGGNIKEPRKIRDLRVVYPSAAVAANVSGVVILEGTIGRAGTVGNLRVLRSVPSSTRRH